MSKIRAVIFDMDGVLIDAREWHYLALNRALSLFGFTITREMHEGGFDGLPTKEKLLRLTHILGLPVSLHSFINDMKQQYTMTLIEEHCRPVPARTEALSHLHQGGYLLAVASNSIRQSIESMLGRAGLLPWLQFTLSNEDVVKGKPDPEIYIKAIQKLGLNPQECVVVEDNPHGVAAARAAGAYVLNVKDPSEVTWFRIRDFILQVDSGLN